MFYAVIWSIQVQGGTSNFALLVAEVGDHHANLCLYNLSCLEFSCLQLIKDGLVEQVVAKLRNSVEHCKFQCVIELTVSSLINLNIPCTSLFLYWQISFVLTSHWGSHQGGAQTWDCVMSSSWPPEHVL